MPLLLKAFLSHRYQAPAVNTYFYEVFAETAELQFDVDRGTGSTNVTRLERMIRDADAFVGIYPVDVEGAGPPTRQQLLDSSAYFRLELGLAVRAKTPAIVFVDRRFGPILDAPSSILSCSFDHQEVTGRGGSPNRPRFQEAFERFANSVEASMRYERSRPLPQSSLVGLLLPPDAYDAALIDQLEALTADASIEIERLPWPPRLDGRLISRLQSFDWVVADVGVATAHTGVAGFLHGQFIPTLRLARHTDSTSGDTSEAGVGGSARSSTIPASLYGGHEVGYPKDIVTWRTRDELLPAFKKRLARITEESRRIGAVADAGEYFQEAARRKEAVFVSYSGADEDRVIPITQALRKRFQSVFDYRDGGQSIEPGQPWLNEIFAKLDRSAVGILMLSPAYFNSGNCAHEARSVIAARDGGKMTMIPIKLGREEMVSPPWLTDIQYLRAWEHADSNAIVERIIKLLSPGAGSQS
jgi:hypothetical protein